MYYHEFKDLRKVVVDEGSYPTVEEQIYEWAGEFRDLWSAAVTSEEKNGRRRNWWNGLIMYNREGNRVELTVCYK